MKKILIKITIGCAIVFAISAWQINREENKVAELELQAQSLLIEVDENNSGLNMTVITLKSFFDGLTFGQFAKDGMLTEYNKQSDFEVEVKQRAARIDQDYLQSANRMSGWVTLRSVSLYSGIACIAGIIVMNKKSKRETSAPQNQKA